MTTTRDTTADTCATFPTEPQARSDGRRINGPRHAPHMAPAHCSLDHMVGPRHAAAQQPLQVPRVVVRRHQAVADEAHVERRQQGERRASRRPAGGAHGAHGHRGWWRASGSGLAWHAQAEIEVHGQSLIYRAARERPDRAENRCCRARVRPATELGRVTSDRARLSRCSRSLPLVGSIAVGKADLALDAQRRRSR